MKTYNILLLATGLVAANLSTPQARAQFAFTNLAYFGYTNPPNLGANIAESPLDIGASLLSHPSALVQASDGTLYATTWAGGNNLNGNEGNNANGNGTVFKITTDGGFTSLYSFGTLTDNNGNPLDGSHPAGNLIIGEDGNLYGTTLSDGNPANGAAGTIFEMTTNGQLSVLYTFGNNLAYDTNADVNAWTTSDGANPASGLVQGSDGYFYGTTSSDGLGGGGTVFQFIPGLGLNTLFSFPNFNGSHYTNDGSEPLGELTEGPDGNFYGTTSTGGTNYLGTIFRITTEGALTTLYSFTNGHCYNPLVLATDGNFYGAAGETVFRMTTNGVVSTVTEVPFQDPNGLLQGSDGNLYFTTTVWGPLPSEGGGVYQLTTSGVLTNAYSFLNTSNSPGGCNSQAALTQGPDGNFYGITSGAGSYGYGGIFRIVMVPSCQSISLSGSQISLTWSLMPGQNYQMQSTASLSAPDWLNVGAHSRAATTIVTNSDNLGTNTQRFYRLSIAQ